MFVAVMSLVRRPDELPADCSVQELNHTLGDANEDKCSVPELTGRLVVLSTVIGARSITLPAMKYVFIPPYVRSSSLHPSGISRIRDFPVVPELHGNMGGLCARDSDGLVTDIKMKHTASGQEQSTRDDSEDVLQNLDEWYEVMTWRQSIKDSPLWQCLPEIPEDAKCLLEMRFKDVQPSGVTMSPRMANLVEEAKKRNVGLEVMKLASIIECRAGTFNPQDVYLTKYGPNKICPLLGLEDVLDDVDADIWVAGDVAQERGTSLMQLKIFTRRLKKARELWWKNDRWELWKSDLDEAEQSNLLIELLARWMPELVACA